MCNISVHSLNKLLSRCPSLLLAQQDLPLRYHLRQLLLPDLDIDQSWQRSFSDQFQVWTLVSNLDFGGLVKTQIDVIHVQFYFVRGFAGLDDADKWKLLVSGLQMPLDRK